MKAKMSRVLQYTETGATGATGDPAVSPAVQAPSHVPATVTAQLLRMAEISVPVPGRTARLAACRLVQVRCAFELVSGVPIQIRQTVIIGQMRGTSISQLTLIALIIENRLRTLS